MVLGRLAISDEGFIFDPETGNSYTVNSTGLLIIKLLKKGESVDNIVKYLTEEFEVDEQEARADLLDFIEQLRIHGVVADEEN